jgi:hypothetical protein
MSPLVPIGFGVAGAGVVVGAITGGISFAQAKDLQDQCPNDHCAADLEGNVDHMMALGTASTVSFVIAGLGAGVGVVGLLLPGAERSEGARLPVAPVIGAGTITLLGRF